MKKFVVLLAMTLIQLALVVAGIALLSMFYDLHLIGLEKIMTLCALSALNLLIWTFIAMMGIPFMKDIYNGEVV